MEELRPSLLPNPKNPKQHNTKKQNIQHNREKAVLGSIQKDLFWIVCV